MDPTVSFEARLRHDRMVDQARAFDRIGARYDEAFPYKQGQIDAGQWLISKLPKGAHVLDVGCGTGVPTARQLSGAGLEVTGIDISETMLDLARQDVRRANFRQLDVLELEESQGPFDGIVAFFSLLMLPRAEIPVALERLHDVLRADGYLAIAMVEADVDDLSISFLGNPVRVTGYPREQLASVIHAAGFEIVDFHELAYTPASEQATPETQLFLYCRRSPAWRS